MFTIDVQVASSQGSKSKFLRRLFQTSFQSQTFRGQLFMGQNVFYNILRGLTADISTHGIWREMIKVEKVASEPGTTVMFHYMKHLLYQVT